jgi:hypothetical protein
VNHYLTCFAVSFVASLLSDVIVVCCLGALDDYLSHLKEEVGE